MLPGRVTLGAIDAGSNAIRMVVAGLSPSPSPSRFPHDLARELAHDLVRIEAERVPVRLGHGAFTRGELDEVVIDQAVAAFVHFRERFNHHGVSIYRAVGTSAIRNASNRDVLLHRLYHEAGIELEVIEGEDEARLVRKSVIHALGATTPPLRAILDLGGGSLEVNLRHGRHDAREPSASIGEARSRGVGTPTALPAGRGSSPEGSIWRGHSLPVGTVRLLETFGLDGAIAENEAGMVRRYTATLMHTVMHSVVRGANGNGLAAITGGNAEALAKIVGDGHPVMPSFELVALEKALPEVLGASVEGRMERFGIKRDRAEVLGIAALVFATAARQLGIAKLVSPGVGIREAVLLELAETAREEQAKAEGAHDKALLTAARTFANRVDHDTTHGEHVRQLARALFHQLRDVHGIPDDRGVLLEVAALLHDVGEVVNVRGHHKHSEYMIRWARIPGLDELSREMIALLARTHRKDAARARQIINDSTLTKEHRAQLRKLSGLLRVADALDSAHRSRVEQVVCTRMGETIVLDLIVRDGPSRDDAQLLRKSDLLAEELGLAIKITVARPVAPPIAEPRSALLY